MHSQSSLGNDAIPLQRDQLAGAANGSPRQGLESVSPCHDAAVQLPPSFQLSAWGLWHAFCRQWLLALPVAILGSIFGASAGWFLMPAPKAVAQALLQVEASQPWIVFHKGDSRAEFQSYQRTQIALVKSRLVLNAALRQPEVSNLALVKTPIDPVTWLQKELQVDFTIAPEIMRIAIAGYDPDEQKVMVDEVCKAYLDEIVKREESKRRERMEKLKEIHERYEETLRSKRRTVRELAESVGSSDSQTVALRQRHAQEQVSMTSKELLQLSSELRKARNELFIKKSKMSTLSGIDFSDVEINSLLDKDAVIEKFRLEEAKLQQEVKDYLKVAAPGGIDQRLRDYNVKIEETKQRIATRKNELVPVITVFMAENAAKVLKKEVDTLEERVSLLVELRKTLESELAKLHDENKSLNKGSLDLESYKQEIAQAEETSRKVATELEALSVEMRATPRISEIEKAVITQPDDYKRRLLAAITCALGMFSVCCGLISYIELTKQRIGSEKDLVHDASLQLLGTIPNHRTQLWNRWMDSSFCTATMLEKIQKESLHAIQAKMFHCARKDGKQIFLITSAVGSEGKTTLASRLAKSIAQSGMRTLLIDCDFRKPSLHDVFAVDRSPGFSEACAGNTPIEQVIQPTKIANLSLLTSGNNRKLSINTIAKDQATDLFCMLRKQFDYIILDSSPLLPVADTLLLTQHTDTVIITAMQNVSQYHKIASAFRMAKNVGSDVLGVVLVGTGINLHDTEYKYVKNFEPLTMSDICM